MLNKFSVMTVSPFRRSRRYRSPFCPSNVISWAYLDILFYEILIRSRNSTLFTNLFHDQSDRGGYYLNCICTFAAVSKVFDKIFLNNRSENAP